MCNSKEDPCMTASHLQVISCTFVILKEFCKNPEFHLGNMSLSNFKTSLSGHDALCKLLWCIQGWRGTVPAGTKWWNKNLLSLFVVQLIAAATAHSA